MAKTPLVIQRFDGGWSTDLKIGSAHSFAYSNHMDFRKSPTQLTILPKTVKESSTTVTGLITEIIQLPSGKIVAIDGSGGVYTRSTAGVWAKNGTTLTDTAMGMVYDEQQDTIWIPGLNSLHSVTNADGRFSGGTFTVNSSAITALVDQLSTAGNANTYTTTNAINEGATHRLTFTPTIEPQYSVRIWVTTKGTDALTVTMHDAANNILSTKTIANAAITNGAYNEFIFNTPVRTTSGSNGASYHFHITHASASSSTIGVSTASSFATTDYQTLANRLVSPRNLMHPAKNFLQYTCIGNERYLSVWEVISQTAPTALEFVQHRLTFPTGYEVTGLAEYTEYLAIACERRSTSSTNEFQQGKIFFWDGTSATYNFVIDVPEGAPYSIYSSKNVVYYYANGGWWAWSGGNPVKLRQMPNTDFEYTDANTYMVNYPNTMAVRNGILVGGFPSETNSTAVEHAIYSFGSRDRNFSESFGYSYTISSGTKTNGTLRIGCVKSYGDKLFISWRDGATYGVDIVDPNSDPFATASWESLILDDGRPNRTKEANELFIDFDVLPTGATVTPKYKIDRASGWTSGTTVTAGGTQAQVSINKRYKEIQVGMDLVATATTPVIIGLTLIRDTLGSEKD